MASFLDISLVGYFSNIFVFLFVFAGIYALLIKSKMLGESKNIASIISIAVAIIVSISNNVSNLIKFVLPWFFVLGLVMMMFIFIGKMFGTSDSTLKEIISWKKTPIVVWVIIFVVLILIFGFGQIFGQGLLEKNSDFNQTRINYNHVGNESLPVDSEKYGSNSLATIVHPKVMGMIVLMVVGLSAIMLITKSGFPQA